MFPPKGFKEAKARAIISDGGAVGVRRVIIPVARGTADEEHGGRFQKLISFVKSEHYQVASSQICSPCFLGMLSEFLQDP